MVERRSTCSLRQVTRSHRFWGRMGDCPVTAGLREAGSVSSLHPNPLRVTAAHAISAVTKQTQTFPHE